jgi:hypothetical protein
MVSAWQLLVTSCNVKYTYTCAVCRRVHACVMHVVIIDYACSVSLLI